MNRNLGNGSDLFCPPGPGRDGSLLFSVCQEPITEVPQYLSWSSPSSTPPHRHGGQWSEAELFVVRQPEHRAQRGCGGRQALEAGLRTILGAASGSLSTPDSPGVSG